MNKKFDYFKENKGRIYITDVLTNSQRRKAYENRIKRKETNKKGNGYVLVHLEARSYRFP